MAVGWEVRDPFADRIQAFVREAYPARLLQKVSGGFVDDDTQLPVKEALEHQGYIRKLRRGDVDQPPAVRAWKVGQALGVLSKKRWVHPVVMLFVSGHYGHVAQVLINAPDQILSRSRRIDLARALPTVAFPVADATPTRAEKRHELMRDGLDELTAHEAAAWDEQMPPAERDDRRTWSVTMREYAAMKSAWNAIEDGPSLRHGSIATAQLITQGATYPVEERDRIAVLLICEALCR